MGVEPTQDEIRRCWSATSSGVHACSTFALCRRTSTQVRLMTFGAAIRVRRGHPSARPLLQAHQAAMALACAGIRGALVNRESLPAEET
jgi:hypothetical protein